MTNRQLHRHTPGLLIALLLWLLLPVTGQSRTTTGKNSTSATEPNPGTRQPLTTSGAPDTPESNIIEINLADCINTGLKNATETRRAGNNLRLQGATVLKNYGRFLPTVTLQSSYTPYHLDRGYNITAPTPDLVTTKTRGADLTLSTSLNLFNGFRDQASLNAATRQCDAARYTLERAIQTITFDVTQSYFQLLLDTELLDIARENLRSIHDQLTLTERQWKVGIKSKVDLDQQKADTEQSRLALIRAETTRTRSMYDLASRLGIDPPVTIIAKPEPEELALPAIPGNIDSDSLATLALSKRPDLLGLKAQSQATAALVTAARSTLYPSLDLNVLLTTAAIEYPDHEHLYPPIGEQLRNTIGYTASLQLSWTIFDGFQRHATITEARVNAMQSQLDLEDLRSAILTDLYKATAEYRSAITQRDVATTGIEAAKTAFTAVQRKYDLGAASFIELSNARTALLNARSALSQATFNLVLQRHVLDYTTGNGPTTTRTRTSSFDDE